MSKGFNVIIEERFCNTYNKFLSIKCSLQIAWQWTPAIRLEICLTKSYYIYLIPIVLPNTLFNLVCSGDQLLKKRFL